MSPERALAGAIVARLRADAGVRALLGDPARLYDEPPKDPVFPYATLGEVETRANDSANAHALSHSVSVHIWSRYSGRAEALDAMSAVREALHDQALTLSGHRLVLLQVVFCDVFRAGDGETTHAIVRLRAITEPNS